MSFKIFQSQMNKINADPTEVKIVPMKKMLRIKTMIQIYKKKFSPQLICNKLIKMKIQTIMHEKIIHNFSMCLKYFLNLMMKIIINLIELNMIQSIKLIKYTLKIVTVLTLQRNLKPIVKCNLQRTKIKRVWHLYKTDNKRVIKMMNNLTNFKILKSHVKNKLKNYNIIKISCWESSKIRLQNNNKQKNK